MQVYKKKFEKCLHEYLVPIVSSKSYQLSGTIRNKWTPYWSDNRIFDTLKQQQVKKKSNYMGQILNLCWNPFESTNQFSRPSTVKK